MGHGQGQASLHLVEASGFKRMCSSENSVRDWFPRRFILAGGGPNRLKVAGDLESEVVVSLNGLP